MADIQLLKALGKGLLTYVPGVTAILEKRNGKSRHSGSQAQFCYTLWLSILRLLEENGIQANMDSVGEIGTGGSLGVGFCAILTGCTKFYALEINQDFDKRTNLKLLDDIVLLFRHRSKISDKFKQLNIKTKNPDFPDDLIKPMFTNSDLIDEIRNDIASGFTTQKRISIIKNWECQTSSNLDFIFSRAVMEHVANPAKVYNSISKQISVNSYMFHDIEFHSHGLTKNIDGHFQLHPFLWNIIVGKRPFFLNRWKLDDHLRAISQNSFEIIDTKKNYFDDSMATGKVLIGVTVLAKKRHE